MIERFAKATIKATGEKITYLYRDAWNVRYYSFNGGKSWHTSKIQAYQEAKKEEGR